MNAQAAVGHGRVALLLGAMVYGGITGQGREIRQERNHRHALDAINDQRARRHASDVRPGLVP